LEIFHMTGQNSFLYYATSRRIPWHI